MRRTSDKLFELLQENGLIRSRELKNLGISRNHLARLLNSGRLIRLGRGIYAEAHVEMSSELLWAQACKQVTSGVLCLASALQFHNLGTQTPSEIWVAIPRHAHRPHFDYPPIHLVEFSCAAHQLGILESGASGAKIRVYDTAKTVVDCFRFRNTIGQDVALEALKDYLRRPGSSAKKLMDYASVCRIATVMRPYVEALQ